MLFSGRTGCSGSVGMPAASHVALRKNSSRDGMAVSANYDEWRESAKNHGLNSRRFKESVEGLTKKDMVSLRHELYRTVPKATAEASV